MLCAIEKFWVLLKRGMENRTEWKTEWNGKRNEKIRRKTKYMNFRETTTYKGKRFETKLNFDF